MGFEGGLQQPDYSETTIPDTIIEELAGCLTKGKKAEDRSVVVGALQTMSREVEQAAQYDLSDPDIRRGGVLPALTLETLHFIDLADAQINPGRHWGFEGGLQTPDNDIRARREVVEPAQRGILPAGSQLTDSLSRGDPQMREIIAPALRNMQEGVAEAAAATELAMRQDLDGVDYSGAPIELPDTAAAAQKFVEIAYGRLYPGDWGLE